MYEFPEFPWPKELRPAKQYPTGQQVQEYIRAYAEHFGLLSHIRLNCKVVRLTWRPKSRTWEALYADTEQEKFFKVAVDYVVICTGIYSTPFVPPYAGSELFAGTQLHAKDFTDASVVSGRRVIIVGAGKTALDCVCTLAASRTAASVTMLYRQAHWPLPRTVLGLSIRRLLFNRATPAMLPPYYTAGRVERAVHAAARPLKRLFWKGLEHMVAIKCGVTDKMRPHMGLPADMFYGGQILDDRPNWQTEGEGFSAIRGEIKSFVRNGVILQDGSFLPADLVLYCTGYTKSYEYFDGETRSKLGLQKDGLYLYRNCLPCEVPHLAFVGSEVSTYSNILTYGLQALWLSHVLSGQVKLPSPADMADDVRAQQHWRRKVMPAQRSRGAVLMLYGMQYHDQLLHDMGISPRRKGLNLLAECFGVYSSRDYTDLLRCGEEAGQRAGAAATTPATKRSAAASTPGRNAAAAAADADADTEADVAVALAATARRPWSMHQLPLLRRPAAAAAGLCPRAASAVMLGMDAPAFSYTTVRTDASSYIAARSGAILGNAAALTPHGRSPAGTLRASRSVELPSRRSQSFVHPTGPQLARLAAAPGVLAPPTSRSAGGAPMASPVRLPASRSASVTSRLGREGKPARAAPSPPARLALAPSQGGRMELADIQMEGPNDARTALAAARRLEAFASPFTSSAGSAASKVRQGSPFAAPSPLRCTGAKFPAPKATAGTHDAGAVRARDGDGAGAPCVAPPPQQPSVIILVASATPSAAASTAEPVAESVAAPAGSQGCSVCGCADAGGQSGSSRCVCRVVLQTRASRVIFGGKNRNANGGAGASASGGSDASSSARRGGSSSLRRYESGHASSATAAAAAAALATGAASSVADACSPTGSYSMTTLRSSRHLHSAASALAAQLYGSVAGSTGEAGGGFMLNEAASEGGSVGAGKRHSTSPVQGARRVQLQSPQPPACSQPVAARDSNPSASKVVFIAEAPAEDLTPDKPPPPPPPPSLDAVRVQASSGPASEASARAPSSADGRPGSTSSIALSLGPVGSAPQKRRTVSKKLLDTARAALSLSGRSGKAGAKPSSAAGSSAACSSSASLSRWHAFPQALSRSLSLARRVGKEAPSAGGDSGHVRDLSTESSQEASLKLASVRLSSAAMAFV